MLCTNYLLQEKKSLATVKFITPKKVFIHGIDVSIAVQKR